MKKCKHWWKTTLIKHICVECGERSSQYDKKGYEVGMRIKCTHCGKVSVLDEQTDNGSGKN